MANRPLNKKLPNKGADITDKTKAPLWVEESNRPIFNQILKWVDREIVGEADLLAINEIAQLVAKPDKPLTEKRLLKEYLTEFGLTPIGRVKLMTTDDAKNQQAQADIIPSYKGE